MKILGGAVLTRLLGGQVVELLELFFERPILVRHFLLSVLEQIFQGGHFLDALAELFLRIPRTIGDLFQLGFDLFELLGHFFADLRFLCPFLNQIVHLLLDLSLVRRWGLGDFLGRRLGLGLSGGGLVGEGRHGEADCNQGTKGGRP